MTTHPMTLTTRDVYVPPFPGPAMMHDPRYCMEAPSPDRLVLPLLLSQHPLPLSSESSSDSGEDSEDDNESTPVTRAKAAGGPQPLFEKDDLIRLSDYEDTPLAVVVRVLPVFTWEDVPADVEDVCDNLELDKFWVNGDPAYVVHLITTVT